MKFPSTYCFSFYLRFLLVKAKGILAGQSGSTSGIMTVTQFSKEEKLTGIKISKDELLSQETSFPTQKKFTNEILDGEDEKQWYRKKYKKSVDDWTENDEKWSRNIQEVLKENDEDYDGDFEETKKIIEEIENRTEKSNPEKSKSQWLFEVEKGFQDDFFKHDNSSQYSDIKQDVHMTINEKDNFYVHYSWLFKMRLKNSKTKRAQPFKRFWSV